jgi:hypothetical protein
MAPPTTARPSTRFTPWISGNATWTVDGHCYFNSALRIDGMSRSVNAQLNIYLRLYLVRKDARHWPEIRKTPASPDLVQDWNDAEFKAFQDDVKSQADRFWDKRFCLVNVDGNNSLDVEVAGDRVRPNVDCRFEVVWANSPASAHQIINCFKLQPGKSIISFTRGTDDGSGVGQFNNTDTQVGMYQIPEYKEPCRKPYGDPLAPGGIEWRDEECPAGAIQLGAVHEVGHLLGLPHVGTARRGHQCIQAMLKDPKEGPNARPCYTEPTLADAKNIMGQGSEIAPWNAMPWVTRLFQHTGIGPQAWKVMNRTVAPAFLWPARL